MQAFHFHRAIFAKIQKYFYLFIEIFVQQHDGSLATGQNRPITGCVYARCLKLLCESGFEQPAAAEQTSKLEAMCDRLKNIFLAEGSNGRIEGMWMRCNFGRRCPLLFKQYIAWQKTAHRVCHRFAGASVKVDAGVVVASQ